MLKVSTIGSLTLQVVSEGLQIQNPFLHIMEDNI